MPDATSQPTVEAPPKSPQTQPWWEQVADQVASRALNVRIAHDAMCMDLIGCQAKIVERLALKQQDGTVGQPGDPEGWEAEPMIHVGDIHQYQTQPAPQPVPQPASSVSVAGSSTEAAPAPAAPASPSPTKPLWKHAAAVAALVAGIGGSAGLASYLTSILNKPAQQQTQAESPSPPGYGVEVEKASGGGN